MADEKRDCIGENWMPLKAAHPQVIVKTDPIQTGQEAAHPQVIVKTDPIQTGQDLFKHEWRREYEICRSKRKPQGK